MNRTIKTLFAVAGALVCLPAAAQNYKLARQGATESEQGMIYTCPATEIVVDLRIATTTLTPGPYARFAQRFLGTMAPLAEKQNSAIVSAEISYTDTDTPQQSCVPEQEPQSSKTSSHLYSAENFADFATDKTGMNNKSAEDMAHDVAAIIYRLRQSRIELITGTAGENVFGAGLEAALNEIDRLENEYIALFLGKQTTTERSYRYKIVPEKGKNSYVVCRFTDAKGVLPENDLSGQPVVLDMRSEGKLSSDVKSVDPKKASGRAVNVLVADNVTCKVMNGKDELAKTVIPVYQFGQEMTVDIAQRKTE